MARLPRAEVPGWPQLVQQRSHDGVPWIRDEVDGLRALADLKEVSAAAGVQVHAYAIVAEQMLLLVTPDAPAGVSRMMQAFGRRYVGAFNRRHARAGTLWAGRYRSAMLDPAHFLLDAMVMVDALGAGRVGGLAFTSLAHHLGQGAERWLVDHSAYWALGNTPFERHLSWARRVELGLDAAIRDRLLAGLRGGWPIISGEQVSVLEAAAGRRLAPARRGRPKKIQPDPN